MAWGPACLGSGRDDWSSSSCVGGFGFMGFRVRYLPGPWMSYLFEGIPYKFIGHNPKKEGHPGSR